MSQEVPVRHGPLPRERHERSIEMVRRSLPSIARVTPDLPAEAALELRKAANTAALLYAAIEDDTDECYRLADEINGSGVVVDVIDPDQDDSLVHSIEEVGGVLDQPLLAVGSGRG